MVILATDFQEANFDLAPQLALAVERGRWMLSLTDLPEVAREVDTTVLGRNPGYVSLVGELYCAVVAPSLVKGGAPLAAPLVRGVGRVRD